MSYTVEVTREGAAWIANVADLAGAHTFAHNLVALDHNVREVIALVLDLAEGAEASLELEYAYTDVPAIVVDAAAFGTERKARAAEMKAMQTGTADQVLTLAGAGYSVRDIAHLLGITPGRVSQLAPRARLSA